MKGIGALCKNKIISFRVFHQTRDDIQQFLIDHNILPYIMFCPECQQECYFDQTNRVFYCVKTRMEQNGHKVKKKKSCSFLQSHHTGTWCENSKLSYQQITKIMLFFFFFFCTMSRGFHIQQFVIDKIGILIHTTVDWQSFCCQLCLDFIDKHSVKLGGPGKIYEIDKVKIGK